MSMIPVRDTPRTHLVPKRSHIAPCVTQSCYQPVESADKYHQNGANYQAARPFPSDDPQSRHPAGTAAAPSHNQSSRSSGGEGAESVAGGRDSLVGRGERDADVGVSLRPVHGAGADEQSALGGEPFAGGPEVESWADGPQVEASL